MAPRRGISWKTNRPSPPEDSVYVSILRWTWQLPLPVHGLLARHDLRSVTQIRDAAPRRRSAMPLCDAVR
ncbi:MAG: hypothetical protein ACYDDF_00025 [Thermoplasmatota archaeon]